MELWTRLLAVRYLRFTASGSASTGWVGVGTGSVLVTSVRDVLTFDESGTWQPAHGRSNQFTNVYRWTKLAGGTVRLEHLRYGPEKPVELFELTNERDGLWVPITPHLCVADCYTATLTLHADVIRLAWQIDGPKKCERIEYEYW